MSKTTLADLIARQDPRVMLGPPWSTQRWPVSSNARGYPYVDEHDRIVADENGQPGLSWWVPYGEGWEIPAGFEYSGTGPVFDWAIWIQVVEGKAECLAVTCWAAGRAAITAEAYRKLPLGRLVHDGVLLASRPADEIPKRHVLWGSRAEAEAERAAVAETHRRRKRSPRERKPISDEKLQDVARIYREELSGGAPTKAVAKRLHYSRASAGRLVALARERGFLGDPLGPRRAGEESKDA